MAEAVSVGRPDTLDEQLDSVRQAQLRWSRQPIRRRLAHVRALRQGIARHAQALAGAVQLRQRASIGETLSAEVLPLADACRFLERNARVLLRTRREGSRGRPFWLWGSHVEIHREPCGVVLILAPANYPLLLPGVQLVQALVAGNAVLLKPGRGGSDAARALIGLLRDAGFPRDLAVVLDESVEIAGACIDAGVDKVLLTGSAETGQAVLERLSRTLTPSVMELSGCDAVLVTADADPDLAARALRFGATLNGGATCIAPRRVYVVRERHADLTRSLERLFERAPATYVESVTVRRIARLAREALAGGATILAGTLPHGDRMRPLVLDRVPPSAALLREDLAAPLLSLVPVQDEEQALALANDCPYKLGVTIFGKPSQGRALARRVRAGVVVINDMIVPTADPRLPFGGGGASGFGVTRGAEGLLELTRVKAVVRRDGRFRPHFDPVGATETRLLAAFIQASHARSLRGRWRAMLTILTTLIRSARKAGKRG